MTRSRIPHRPARISTDRLGRSAFALWLAAYAAIIVVFFVVQSQALTL